jgi:hypothetical protein
MFSYDVKSHTLVEIMCSAYQTDTYLPAYMASHTKDVFSVFLIQGVRKRLYPLFIFFRCPVCGEWCKLH